MNPARTLAAPGDTVIELSTALQVRTVLPTMDVAGSVALMVLVPLCRQFAGWVTPKVPRVALVKLLLAQVTEPVRSRVVASE